MIEAFGYGVAAVVAYVVILAALIHVWPRRTPGVPVLLVLWIAIGALTGVVIVLVEPLAWPTLVLTNLAVYGFLVEAFIFTYAVTLASLSVKLTVALIEHGTEHDAFGKALQHYSADFFLDHRLQRLVEQGLLCRSGERYCVTPRGRTWAHAGALVKQLLAVGDGG